MSIWRTATAWASKLSSPDVNQSDVDFTVRERKIFFGLSAVKGCGGAAGESIAAARKKDGPFQSIYDFCERVEASECNRATVETLIKAGAFDSLGVKRAQLMAVVEKAIQAGSTAHADRRSGQMNLFAEEILAKDAPRKRPTTFRISRSFPKKPSLSWRKRFWGCTFRPTR